MGYMLQFILLHELGHREQHRGIQSQFDFASASDSGNPISAIQRQLETDADEFALDRLLHLSKQPGGASAAGAGGLEEFMKQFYDTMRFGLLGSFLAEANLDLVASSPDHPSFIDRVANLFRVIADAAAKASLTASSYYDSILTDSNNLTLLSTNLGQHMKGIIDIPFGLDKLTEREPASIDRCGERLFILTWGGDVLTVSVSDVAGIDRLPHGKLIPTLLATGGRDFPAAFDKGYCVNEDYFMIESYGMKPLSRGLNTGRDQIAEAEDRVFRLRDGVRAEMKTLRMGKLSSDPDGQGRVYSANWDNTTIVIYRNDLLQASAQEIARVRRTDVLDDGATVVGVAFGPNYADIGIWKPKNNAIALKRVSYDSGVVQQLWDSSSEAKPSTLSFDRSAKTFLRVPASDGNGKSIYLWEAPTRNWRAIKEGPRLGACSLAEPAPRFVAIGAPYVAPIDLACDTVLWSDRWLAHVRASPYIDPAQGWLVSTVDHLSGTLVVMSAR